MSSHPLLPMLPYYDDGRPHPAVRLLGVTDHGCVLAHGEAPLDCDRYGARDVWVFADAGRYYLHYDGAGPTGWLCCLAESTDLINWTKRGPVLALGEPGSHDSASASYGTTFRDGDVWHMFYLGTPNTSSAPDRVPSFPYNTLHATAPSPTGPWTKQEREPIVPCIPGTYTASSASPGQVVRHGDGYLQFVACSTGAFGDTEVKRGLGLARNSTLEGLWEIDPEPMLPLTEQIENASLYFDEERRLWYLFTNHVGLRKGEEFTDAIWVYWSPRVDHWMPQNKALVLDCHGSSHSQAVIGLPSVLRMGDRLALFYDAPAGHRIDHMHRDVCLAWITLPLKLEPWIPKC